MILIFFINRRLSQLLDISSDGLNFATAYWLHANTNSIKNE